MIPASFDYSAPTSLEEALKLLNDLGDEAKVLAGGHSLIPMMKLRFAEPEHLVDLNNVPGLSEVSMNGESLTIGAMAREVDVEDSAEVAKVFPIFKDAAKLIADPQVRNFGTIGGNLAHGDAANDQPAVMIALNADLEITGLEGKRTVSIDEFFFGFYMTAIQDGEILTQINIPIPSAKCGNAYNKLERKVGDYATAGVAVHLEFDGSGTCTKAGIGLTNVNPLPLRAERSQEALVGTKVDDAAIEAAGQCAYEDCNPSTDLRGSEDYKRRVVKAITKKMIKLALERAQS